MASIRRNSSKRDRRHIRRSNSAFSLSGALAACIALSPLAVRAASNGCDDDFSAATLASSWTFIDADGEPGGAARINGGKLELTGKGSDAFNTVNEFVGVKRAAEAGDFDVSVKIESQAATNGWAQAGILAANDAADPSKGGYVIVDVTPANGYHVFYDAAGSVGTLDKHADVGTTAYPVWLRLTRSGTRFSAWYKSQPQATWSVIAEKFETQGTGTASQLALVSLSHNDSLEGKTVFDDFTCQGRAAALSGSRPWMRDAKAGFGWGRADGGSRFETRSPFDPAGGWFVIGELFDATGRLRAAR